MFCVPQCFWVAGISPSWTPYCPVAQSDDERRRTSSLRRLERHLTCMDSERINHIPGTGHASQPNTQCVQEPLHYILCLNSSTCNRSYLETLQRRPCHANTVNFISHTWANKTVDDFIAKCGKTSFCLQCCPRRTEVVDRLLPAVPEIHTLGWAFKCGLLLGALKPKGKM